MLITNLADFNPWRRDLLPARFNDALFHMEVGSMASGRRIVQHQFPKKDVPYAEDMGREALQFTIRGYILCYPKDTTVDLYRKDYRVARDKLLNELNTNVAGWLQLPTLRVPVSVVCSKWQLREEERYGGYCVIEMVFDEAGRAPFQPVETASDQEALKHSKDLRNQVVWALTVALNKRLQGGVSDVDWEDFASAPPFLGSVS